MSAAANLAPLLAAWLEAQQAFVRTAGAAISTDAAGRSAQESFATQYRLLFALSSLPSAAADAASAGESMGRFQQAAARVGALLNEAAVDAGRRLGAALADDGPGVAPITSLRELQTLWIDCGEAAWAAAAHREDFADAQAELLAAWAAMHAAGKVR